MSEHDNCLDSLKLWVHTKYDPAIERIIRLEEQHEASLNALEKQATEYERRLEDLNHAQALREKRDATFVSEELFDSYQKSVSLKFEETTRYMAENRGKDTGASDLRHIAFEVIALIIAGVAIFIAASS